MFILNHGLNPNLLTALRKLPRATPREQLVPGDEFEAVLAIASNRLQLAMLLARDAGLRRAAVETLTQARSTLTMEKSSAPPKIKHATACH